MQHSSIDPLIGTTVSQYEIVAKLGGGGMGVVYRARDTRLGRTVALKFLPPQWSHDESAKQRFMREAQAASATNHRNICVVHNIEEAADGRLFIVMAYYEGPTLKQKLEDGPLPLVDAVEIGCEIADGLAKAHAQGVVHRDVKPGNLIVSDDGVKILDFGLAKFADALQLTIPGTTIGTVAYMSPEQARGEEADARSDVWALGIVIYEMLTGAPPFRGAYQEATFHAIKNEPLPSLRAARPDVPDGLERIVHKALEKDAATRYQSAREPARDLRLLQGRTVPLELRTEELPALALPRHAPPRRSWRRAMTPLRVAAVAALLALAAAGARWWASRPVERIPVAIVPVANQTGDPGLDRYRLALTQTLIDEISDSPNIRVVPYLRLMEMIRPYIGGTTDPSSNEAMQTVATESGAPFLVVPTLVYRDRESTWLAEIQIRNAATGTAVATYPTASIASSLSQQTAFRLIASAADAVQQHFKVNGPGRSFQQRATSSRFRDPNAALAFEQGLNAFDQLEYAAAGDALRRSVELDDQHAMTYAWQSRLFMILSRRNEAIAAGQRASALIGSNVSPTESAFVKAVLAESQGDLAAAESRYRELVALEPDDPQALTELADFLKRTQDKNAASIDAYHEVLRVDPTHIRPHLELCQLYTRVDNHPLAEREALTALERYRARGLKASEAQALLCLADEQREQGGDHLADARRNVEAARALIADAAQPYNLSRATFYQGLVEDADGRSREAAAFFERAATQAGAVGNTLTEGTALMNLGVAHAQLGQPTLGLDFFRRSRDVFVQMGDERRAAEADVNLAGLQIDYGVDREAALRTLANARANMERLGHADFQLYAMRSEADAQRHGGRIAGARSLLQRAYEIAARNNLTGMMASLNVAMALGDFQANDYAQARTVLEKMTAGGAAIPLDARLTNGRLLTRLGDFAAARNVLDQVVVDVEREQRLVLLPEAHLALGELGYETRDRAFARSHLGAAVAAWTDPLPSAAAAEARCLRGWMDAEAGNRAGGRRELESGLRQAAGSGQIVSDARCRIALARLDILDGSLKGASDTLAVVPDDTSEVAIGPELRAQVEYWRGIVAGRQGAANAGDRVARARALIVQLQASLPDAARQGFAARLDISPILQEPVRIQQ